MKKISRQRIWQKEMKTLGLCSICAQPVCEKTKLYCEKHRIQANRRKIISYHKKYGYTYDTKNVQNGKFIG